MDKVLTNPTGLPMETTPLEPGCRVKLPLDWTIELGIRGVVALEKTAEGILVRPGPPLSWDEVFANKLAVGQAPGPESLEMTGDDLLF